MNSILIWLVVALLGVPMPGMGEATSTDEAIASPLAADSSRTLEQRFAERDMLPPCGMVDVTPRGRGTLATKLSPPAKAWTCLYDAVGMGGAELVTLRTRADGTSISTFYRATRQGRLEIWTQRDRATPGRSASRWTYEECTPAEDLGRQPCAS